MTKQKFLKQDLMKTLFDQTLNTMDYIDLEFPLKLQFSGMSGLEIEALVKRFEMLATGGVRRCLCRKARII